MGNIQFLKALEVPYMKRLDHQIPPSFDDAQSLHASYYKDSLHIVKQHQIIGSDTDKLYFNTHPLF